MRRFSDLVPPDDQAIETLSGVILTMSVLSTLQAASGQSIDTRSLIYAAIGSTVAWGFVDAIMSLIGTLLDRTRTHSVLNGLKEASTLDEFRQRLMDESPDYIVNRLDDNALAQIQNFLRSKNQLRRAGLDKADLQKAFYIWLTVVSAGLPLILPLVLIKDPLLAFRVTQWISVWILFSMGYKLGVWLDIKPLSAGILSAAVGLFIMITCISLGG
jgi:VIT1/CCC1 family predicted Fe2+/Mn2+ transporter